MKKVGKPACHTLWLVGGRQGNLENMNACLCRTEPTPVGRLPPTSHRMARPDFRAYPHYLKFETGNIIFRSIGLESLGGSEFSEMKR